MNKKPIKSKENIIFFPNLERRLAQKGLERLQAKKVSEAIEFLEKAKELDAENEETLIGLVLAYVEAGSFHKAKGLAKEMLLKGIGHYDQMIDLYITILLQLHEYSEIVATIETLLEESEIPADKAARFSTILQFSKRMAENGFPPINEKEKYDLMPEADEQVGEQSLNLYALNDANEQMLLVSRLADKNIRPFMDEIQDYLADRAGHPFLKTLLLNLLKEQEFEKEVQVEKFRIEKIVVPLELPDIRNQGRMMDIVEILQDRLEQKDPILLENIRSLVERHFFIVYPFQLEPDEPRAWAAAFHFLTLEYYGQSPEVTSLADMYRQPAEHLTQAIEWIKEIEEISYPLI
ncbi:tetratricopeptide repeat protein [Neobacillus sp. SM06]|uniref:tetratricopeptide repeat protein n=1 Tax=Neobacillus sp. SM06 TaxID=3422492 RepID=UPI003D26F266